MGRAALVLARETDSFAIHPEFKISQFAEFLNENYVGILSVPLEGGSAITRSRGEHSAGRRNVLVHAEEIRRVVLGFHLL